MLGFFQSDVLRTSCDFCHKNLVLHIDHMSNTMFLLNNITNGSYFSTLKIILHTSNGLILMFISLHI
jgi:hypothetical protein